MATSPESTRPLSNVRHEKDGTLRATTNLTPAVCRTRARISVPATKVIPIVFVPGIMGSNLRASRDPNKKNLGLKPGAPAWRPPNDVSTGLSEAKTWERRTPADRQRILNGATLEVDPTGEIGSLWDTDTGQNLLSPEDARERGWGEIHWSSYGTLLFDLQRTLNVTFRLLHGTPSLGGNWTRLNIQSRATWDGTNEGVLAELSECEIQKVGEYYYPVYAFGYNWLESNEKSADKLRQRIESIIGTWVNAKRTCNSVVVVTHSMGGLVARACAKSIPDKILGVIHGAMPALGAPVCYRRIAYGTESSNPKNNWMENVAAGKFADIAGRTASDTTAVMATAPGALELLPNHLYPEKWLFASVSSDTKSIPIDSLRLPVGSPYELYRNLSAWYRVINPELANPAKFNEGQVEAKIGLAVDQAEKFHTQVLGSYYHPKTFAFYGDDREQQSVASCRWSTNTSHAGISAEALAAARPLSSAAEGARNIAVADGPTLTLALSVQYVAGDGTVPQRSGAGPAGNVMRLFRTRGYDHQGSYRDANMVLLTQHLIARLVQEL